MRRHLVLTVAVFALAAYVLWQCGEGTAPPPRNESPAPAGASGAAASPRIGEGFSGSGGARAAVLLTGPEGGGMFESPVTPTSDVVGRVIDRNGQPCAGVRVSGVHVDDGGASPMGRFEAVSSVGGFLEVETSVLAGSWRIRVDDPWMLAEPQDGLLSADAGQSEMVVVVDAPEVGVFGLVVDEHGAPVNGVVVTGPQVMGRSTTGQDGRFAAYREPGATDRSAVVQFAKTGRSTVVSKAIWGETRLRVVMPVSRLIEVAVVDDATGEPIQTYDLLWTEAPGSGAVYPMDRRLYGPHAGGRVAFECSQGRHVLVTAVPRESTFFPPPYRSIEVDALPGGTLTLRVKQLMPVRVRVMNQSGEAVAAAKVTVAAPLDDRGFGVLTPLVPMTCDKPPHLRDAFVAASGRTDRSGRITLAAPEAAFGIRAEAAGFSAVAVADARTLRGPGGVVRIELPSAAVVSGTLFPAEALPANPHVVIAGADGARVSSAPVDGRGSFSVPDLPRGRWTVMLSSRQLWGQTRVLGEVGVDSARVDCSFDIAHLAASRVDGRVRFGGRFLTKGRVALLPEGSPVPQLTGMSFRPSGSRVSIEEFGNEAPCVNGRFDMEVQAGEYRAKVGVPRVGREGWDWFDGAGVLRVTPGRCALGVLVPLTTLTVEVRGLHGLEGVIAGTLIGKGFERSFGVDGARPIPIDDVPAGSYAVIVRAGELVRSVPVDVVAEPATVVVDFR